MLKKLTAHLFCLHCNKETDYTIFYKDEYLEDIKYNICGNNIRIYRETLLETYTADFADRIFPKSQRMTGEIKKDLSQNLTILLMN